MLSSTLCVESSISPLGLCTAIGLVVNCLFSTGVLLLAKLCVLSVLAMDFQMLSVGLMSGAGGPIVEQVLIGESLSCNNFSIGSCLLIDFYQSQLGA